MQTVSRHFTIIQLTGGIKILEKFIKTPNSVHVTLQSLSDITV